MDNIKTLFVDLYGDQLRKPHTTVIECHFDDYFDQQVRELEGSVANRDVPLSTTPLPFEQKLVPGIPQDDEPPPIPGLLSRGMFLIVSSDSSDHSIGQSKNTYLTSNESTPVATPDISRPTTPSSHILTTRSGPGGKVSRRARKVTNIVSAHASSGDEGSRKSKGAKISNVKKGRRWDSSGLADEDSDVPLDYSAPAIGIATSDGETDSSLLPGAMEAVDQESWGSRTGKGQFVLKDLDDQVHSILSSADLKKADTSAAPSGIVGSSITAISGLFRNVVGGKTLTKADLDKAMKGMEDHLLKKNVAREAAIRLCEGVERELIGVKTGSFESK